MLRLGEAEVEVHPSFRLYLQTKLSSPHFGPEVAAQTTIVNFCVTERGLEDQLLALVWERGQGGGGESGGLLLTGGHTHSPLSLTHLPIHPPTHPAPPPLQVVDHERPDLQEAATALVRQLAEYTITLNKLEDGLLARLAASQVRTCAQECMRRRRVGVGVGGDAVSRAPNNSRCTASRQRHHHPMTLPRTPPPPSCPLTPGRHPGGSPSDREPGGDQAHRHRDCGARGAGQGGWAGVG